MIYFCISLRFHYRTACSFSWSQSPAIMLEPVFILLWFNRCVFFSNPFLRIECLNCSHLCQNSFWSYSCPAMLDPNMSSLKLDPSLYKYIPALPPPPGVTPNFTNPENRSAVGLSIGSMLLGIMIFLYAIRIYVRCYVSRTIFWDDCRSCLTRTLSSLRLPSFYSDVHTISC